LGKYQTKAGNNILHNKTTGEKIVQGAMVLELYVVFYMSLQRLIVGFYVISNLK
jgi:hypothetical protein